MTTAFMEETVTTSPVHAPSTQDSVSSTQLALFSLDLLNNNNLKQTKNTRVTTITRQGKSRVKQRPRVYQPSIASLQDYSLTETENILCNLWHSITTQDATLFSDTLSALTQYTSSAHSLYILTELRNALLIDEKAWLFTLTDNMHCMNLLFPTHNEKRLIIDHYFCDVNDNFILIVLCLFFYTLQVIQSPFNTSGATNRCEYGKSNQQRLGEVA